MYTFSAVKERVINLLYKPFVHILLIAAIGLIAYSNTFHSPFIFDDTKAPFNTSHLKTGTSAPSPLP
jgi:hypothetical protein